MYKKNNFYISQKYGPMIIAPKRQYINKLSKALCFLQAKDLKGFRRITQNLKIIFIAPLKSTYNVLRVKDSAWLVCSQFFEEENSLFYKYLASLLSHEVQHVLQYKQGRKYTGYKAEKEVYLIFNSALILRAYKLRLCCFMVRWTI